MTDPLTIIGEILGDPAASMRNPVNAGYRCPYINGTCVKRGHGGSGSYPVCSIYQSQRKQRLICVCPKRFYGADIAADVIQHCWVGARPANPRVAYEVKMASFGNVDFVIADIDVERHVVREFVSVELQAVDINGSVAPAYDAVLTSTADIEKPNYGVNWANVRKRYITQLITKGFYHHHWGTRIVSVIQSPLYDSLKKAIRFDELPPDSDANIIFMLYDFKPDPDKGIAGAQKMVLDKVIGTSHNSLMMGAMYQTPPPKQAFCDRILTRL